MSPKVTNVHSISWWNSNNNTANSNMYCVESSYDDKATWVTNATYYCTNNSVFRSYTLTDFNNAAAPQFIRFRKYSTMVLTFDDIVITRFD